MTVASVAVLVILTGPSRARRAPLLPGDQAAAAAGRRVDVVDHIAPAERPDAAVPRVPDGGPGFGAAASGGVDDDAACGRPAVLAAVQPPARRDAERPPPAWLACPHLDQPGGGTGDVEVPATGRGEDPFPAAQPLDLARREGVAPDRPGIGLGAEVRPVNMPGRHDEPASCVRADGGHHVLSARRHGTDVQLAVVVDPGHLRRRQRKPRHARLHDHPGPGCGPGSPGRIVPRPAAGQADRDEPGQREEDGGGTQAPPPLPAACLGEERQDVSRAVGRLAGQVRSSCSPPALPLAYDGTTITSTMLNVNIDPLSPRAVA